MVRAKKGWGRLKRGWVFTWSRRICGVERLEMEDDARYGDADFPAEETEKSKDPDQMMKVIAKHTEKWNKQATEKESKRRKRQKI